VKGMKAVADVVRKQPGFIDGVLMEHKNSAKEALNNPLHRAA
jgi:hypothetical protein